MVARSHHVGQREQRRHQRIVPADGEDDEGSVRLRDAHRFALSTVDVIEAVPASVEAGGVEAFPAEDAGAVRPQKRRDDEIARLDSADVCADGLDDANELVPHPAAAVALLHRPVRPEIAATDRGAGDRDEGVVRFDQAGVGDVLDPNVAGRVHDGCSHGRY